MNKPLTRKYCASLIRIKWLAPMACALGIMFLVSSSFGHLRSPANTEVVDCTDQSCSVGVFCNGVERCSGTGSAAVCVAGTPPCGAGQRCNEGSDRCETSCVDPDHDGDGHASVRCGGDDCDDRDVTRYPGRQEVCDAAGHDEDCDPTTYGPRDGDGDSENDIRCCNRDAAGALHCGTDYDDTNSAVRAGSMICDGPDSVVISGSSSSKCPDNTKCIVQPNGTGVCGVPQAGYVAPERFVRPPAPPQLPMLGTTLSFETGAMGQPGAATGSTAGGQTTITSTPAQAVTSPAGTTGDAAQVAECKDLLRAGKISFNGAAWPPESIDRLCDGTTSVKRTIECFDTNQKEVGGAAAVERCKQPVQ